MKKIEWTKTDNMHFSDSRYEFTIYKEGNFWILSYTDFWTSEISDSFFVNVKKTGDEMFAVPALKKYADYIVENRKLNAIEL
jgi:phage-related protein